MFKASTYLKVILIVASISNSLNGSNITNKNVQNSCVLEYLHRISSLDLTHHLDFLLRGYLKVDVYNETIVIRKRYSTREF